jgi:transcription antitermination factor NusG
MEPLWRSRFFLQGQRVRVTKGAFAGMEGKVNHWMAKQRSVRVELTIFGRSAPVELKASEVAPKEAKDEHG